MASPSSPLTTASHLQVLGVPERADRRVWNALSAAPEERDDGTVGVVTSASATAVAGVLGRLGLDLPVREHSDHAVTRAWCALGLEMAVDSAVDRDALARVMLALGWIDEGQFVSAVLEQARTGSAAVDVLVADGVVTQEDLAAVLAHESGVQRVALVPDDVVLELARLLPVAVAHRLGCLPVHRVEDLVFLAVAEVLSVEQLGEVEPFFGGGVSFHQLLITRGNHDELLQWVHRDGLSRQAKSALLVRPGWPPYVVGVEAAGVALNSPPTPAHELPVATVLVPLSGRTALVPQLLGRLGGLDYTRAKLDVKLLVAEDDLATIQAIGRLDLPPHLHLVCVPQTLSRSLPQACNYALQLAEGERVVIVDIADHLDERSWT